jgi:signal transduction histidine kinase
MASLFVIQGRDQGRRFDLHGDVISLGRDSANTIQLHDSEVSRHHSQIREVDDGFLLVDLTSSNGCFVNEQQVTEKTLTSGDRVQLGRTLLIFTATDDASILQPAGEVDIIGREIERTGSRIIKSISHKEGSQLLGTVDQSDSPWLARARSNLQIMYRTALAVSHTLDIDQLLQRIMELIFEWVEADRGCIMLLDQPTDQLIPKVSRSRQQAAGIEPEKLEISRTILDYVVKHKEGVLTSDASEDQRWDPAASIVKMGVREAICVPMQGRYGMVGTIYIDTYTPPGRLVQRASNKFSEEHLKLMIAIAHQAALAIEDTSYYSAMVQAERLAAMGQTIATLSHHIKNILQGIRGGSYLIEEGLRNDDGEVVRKGWNIVEKNQEKISHLVMDMLTFSKEREPDLMAASLNDLVRDVLELMAVRANEAGVDMELELDASIPDLLFDSEMLHRAILNVVTNAIDACESVDERRVRIRTELDTVKEEVRTIVEDSGGGIAPQDIKQIFSVFESRKGSRGTGLGLPVSQKILREHGGEIVVESELGHGSRFVLSFPVVNPDSDSGHTQEVQRAPAGGDD